MDTNQSVMVGYATFNLKFKRLKFENNEWKINIQTHSNSFSLMAFPLPYFFVVVANVQR